MKKKYWAEILVTRMLDPEHDEEIRSVKHFFMDYIPEDNDTGDTEELKQYAIRHILQRQDFTPDTDCIDVDAHFYNIDEEPPFDDAVSEPHTHIYLEDYLKG